jgi:hypothetical protein
MPPSTATNVRPVCLTVVTRYSVAHELATSDRPGSMTSLAPAGQVASGGRGDRVQVLIDGRRFVLERVPDAEPAAHVVHTNSPSTETASTASGERLGVQDLRPDVQVQPVKLQLLAFADAVIASRAWSRGSPNLESAPPVDCDSWVSGATPGMIRISTRCGGWPSFQPVDVVEVVHHHGADAGVQRHGQLGGGLGVAVLVHPLGRDPGGQGHDELARPGHVDAQPRGGEQLVNGQAG